MTGKTIDEMTNEETFLFFYPGWMESYIMPPMLFPEMQELIRHIVMDDGFTEEQSAIAQNIYRLMIERERETPRVGFIYLLQGGGYCKIGRSIRPSERVLQISPVLPFPVELTHIMCAFDYVRSEQYFHAIFAEKRTNGEWFALDQSDIDDLEFRFSFRNIRPDKVAPETLQAKIDWMKTVFETPVGLLPDNLGPEPGGRYGR